MTAPSEEIIRQVREEFGPRVLLAPTLAISVRQPWAWAVVHGGKDIENRSKSVAGRFRSLAGQEIAIHAAYNMADQEYFEAVEWMARLGVKPPPPDDLWYGGIIGVATVGAVLEKSSSPWFDGPFGVRLEKPRAVDFIGCRGWPGVFKLEQSGVSKTDFTRSAARA